ncbi:glycosyltransferase, partial [Amylibacter sp.]|nr:glycosyltransferase [Amylibacter sp.]
CVIQCSKYEGFGLPLIEAQMRGVAVLCSNIEVFKEIAGKGAIYFDPNDDSDLFNKFETFIISNFEQLVVNGYKNCDRFYANELNTQLRLLTSE